MTAPITKRRALDEYERHVRHDASVSTCGVDIAGHWAFEGREHAAACLSGEASRLLVCPWCALELFGKTGPNTEDEP